MTDDELAFVLCHELSHTIYGHTLKQTQNKAWLAGVQVMTPCHHHHHRTPLCPCPHHSRSQHTTGTMLGVHSPDKPCRRTAVPLSSRCVLSPKTSCLTRRIEFTTRHTNSRPTALTSSACLDGPQVVVLSVLDPTGLTSLLIEAGLGYALKYGGELPMSREAENEADGTKF